MIRKQNRVMVRHFILVMCLILSLPVTSLAWGDHGHRIVARIAERYLTDKTRQAIAQLIEDDPFLMLCTDHDTGKKFPTASLGDKLACVAPWPDPPLKDARLYTANWHFVDIPVKFGDGSNPLLFSYDAARDCKMDDVRGDCAVLALKRLQLVLANAKLSPDDVLRESRTARAEALKFIVHIIGDIHQPLHCVTDVKDPGNPKDIGDLGGNRKIVQWLGKDINPRWTSQWNLHSVWDEGIIDEILRSSSMDETAYLNKLLAELTDEDQKATKGSPGEENKAKSIAERQTGDILAWINGSYQLAVEQAYGELPEFDKNYHYKDSKGTPRTGGYRLDITYFNANRGVVDEQLKTGGVRLAKLLNELLGK